MKKNDLIDLYINDVTIEGKGVGRFENIAVFVQGAAINDKLKVRIIKVNKNYAVGKIEEIVNPSNDRIIPDCVHYPKCGGCSFRHISYESELKIKHKHVSDCLKKIGGFEDIKIEPIIGSNRTNHYRNKSQIPIRKDKTHGIVAGFFSTHSHRVIDCDKCLIHPEEFNTIIGMMKKWIKKYSIPLYDEESHSGLIRHVYLRYAEFTKEIMVCLVINGEDIPFKESLINMIKELDLNIVSLIVNINRKNTNAVLGSDCRLLWGKDHITDTLCGLRFDISPLSFYQVNRSQTEVLYGIIRENVESLEKFEILDLYCGIGTIGLSLAPYTSRIIGMEIVKEAVRDAVNNAVKNSISNCKFICGDTSEIGRKLGKDFKNLGIVVLDPPRKGCSKELLGSILEICPKKIVYVSCNPATLSRDLKILCENDYKITRITPVDMFPRTSHVETVVQLVRKKPDAYIDITVDMDELDLTASEAKATYQKIKDYIFEKHNVKVSSLYIAQVKQKHGIIERENYNNPSDENARQPKCSLEKEVLIEKALRHFKMIS